MIKIDRTFTISAHGYAFFLWKLSPCGLLLEFPKFSVQSKLDQCSFLGPRNILDIALTSSCVLITSTPQVSPDTWKCLQ